MLASNRLGRYHLGERLGEGGMAEVFRAEMEGAAGFTKAVAIKRIRPDLATDEHIAAMFLQEAQVARRLEHGNIVQIFDLGVEDGVPYLVLELVDGVSLDHLLRHLLGRLGRGRARLELAEALYLVEHVAAALHHAHSLTDAAGLPTPVVHRDVNPRNILISRDGVVKLTDFGIAKAWHLPSATLPGTVKGTLGYLSPEQASGAPVDARTDQFSAGVVLYELLAGENPLAGADNLVAYCRLLERGLPRLPVAGAIDAALADIVARAVAVAPGDRFPTIEDLRVELEAWRVSRGLRAAAEAWRGRVRAVLGAAATQPRAGVGLALGNALAAQLDARGGPHTHVPAPAAPGVRPAVRNRRRALAGVLVLAALAAGGAVAVRGLGPAGAPALPAAPAAPVALAAVASPAPAAAAVASPAPAAATAITAPPAAASPGRADTPAALPADAGPAIAIAAPPAAPPRPRVRAPGASAPAASPTRPAPAVPAEVAEPGRLKINLLPYARVTVDGQARGQTPLDLVLPAGEHALVLENPDTGQRRERRIQVIAGETLVIHQW